METQSIELLSSYFYFGYHVLHKCFALLFFALLINSNNHMIASSTMLGNHTDRLALLSFKSQIIRDPQGIFRSWNDSLHFCQWEGVLCGRRHKRVTVLDLSSKSLVGSLSPSIGNVSFLREIRLQNNTLQGQIPPDFGRLPRLQVLNLGNNSFDGEIPKNLSQCSNLEGLSFVFNKLGGKIPTELASLSHLIKFSFNDNFFTGGIPSSLGNLTSLELLSGRQNLLGGTIPDTLGRLRNLVKIGLGRNNLSGMVPLSMFNLSFLTIFSVSENQLHGGIPMDIGLTLPCLEWLQIWGNHFNGSIPISLSNASRLQNINMLYNEFTGKVAVHFGNMRQLRNLHLGANKLGSGEVDELNFVTSLTNCSMLEVLVLESNLLEGVLPESVANLSTQLRVLSVSDNNLLGKLPHGIGNFFNLRFLVMNNNRFSGTIPVDLGQLKRLERLNMKDNFFSGEIPWSLGNLSIMLSELYLGGNQLRGTIPSSLGNCQNLLYLDLSQNNLDGSLPKQFFKIPAMIISLNLSQNRFVGSLPSEISNLFHLNILDVSQNNLSGTIPNSLAQCSKLENLDMNNNFFEGTIPMSWSSFRSLQIVDLSQNNLSGKVPNYLEKLALAYLNLSFNNLEGEVPTKGIFANATAVSVAGNDRLCGGISELQLPRCNADGSKEHEKRFFVKIIALTIASIFSAALFSAFLYYMLRKKKREQSPASSLIKPLWKASFGNIFKATDGFSSANLLGMGSFGFVYKGILEEEGPTLAIKVLNLQQQGASRSFLAECNALRNLRHRNLVKVITACSSIDFQGNDFKAIVYEFMQNGSLEKWLHPISEMNGQPIEEQSLRFLPRINIAIDIANALAYLHHHCQKPIIHCDLKPSNILLDDEMIAHVGDFGLAKFRNQVTNSSRSSSIGVRGTIGYAAPEYGLGSELSTSGDVYSYGIILLEMMTGKKPTDNMFRDGLNLHNFVKMAIPDQVLEIVDPTLLKEDDRALDVHQGRLQATRDSMIECLISIVRIGVQCSMESPADRMEMPSVVNELQKVMNFLSRSRPRSSVYRDHQ